SYQWQSAPAAGGPWTNIAGATSTTLATSATATTFYRLVTTCSNSGLTNTTSTVSYSVTLSGPCQCATYPTFAATSAADEDITNVTVGSMNNSSACNVAAPGPGSIASRYSNFTGSVAGPSQAQGSVVNFSLTQTSCGGSYDNFFQIYVDWNQDGDWLDAGEQVYSQPSTVVGNHTVVGSFNVPLTATLGTTRMRIVNIETTPASTTNYAHTNYTWGETEDYCFTVTVYVPPATPPNCAGSPISPTNGQTNVNVSPTLTWPAVTGASSYDVYFGTSGTPPFVVNTASTSYVPGTLISSTTYYWKIVPKNSVGDAVGCSTWSFTTGIAGCNNGVAYTAYTPTCNGTQEPYAACTYAGEYNNLTLTGGTAYTFGSDIITDYITITDNTGIILAAGAQPLNYTPPASGVYRVYIHLSSACGTANACRNPWVQCGASNVPGNDLVCNASSISCGQTLSGTTVSSTATGTGEGLTCGGPAQIQGGVWYVVPGNGQIMTASLCGTTWDSQISVFSGASCSSLTCVGGVDDNGPACLGTSASFSWTSTVGVNYYILVFGFNSDAAFNLSLTCTTPVANDQCANAVALTAQCSGGTTNVSGTTLGATEDPIADPSCDPGTINDVWYSFNSGAFTSVEVTITLGTATWIGGEVYTACGTLATGLTVGGTAGNCDFYLLNPSPTVISGLTPNTNYLLRIFTNLDFDVPGTFDIRVNYPSVAAPTTTGASTCYGSNAIISSSVSSSWYTGLVGGTAVSTAATTYTTPGLTANTDYYVEAVTGSCVSSPRTPVTVTVSPQPTVIAGATSNSIGCNIYSPNTWSYFVNPSNEIIACVKDATGGNNLGGVSADVNITGTVQYMPTNNAPYIQRVVSISPASNGPADVRLFFTLAEFQALQAAEPLLTNTNQLAVTKFPNATAPYGTGILLTPTLIQTPAQTGIANVYSIDVTVTGFSTFFIHYNSNNFPLPIELLSFTGECNADKAVLKWSTATEQNNSYFTIMKSNNGVDFTDVGMVQGAGNSSTTKQYSWTDQNSGLAPAYYRLKQTDFNGGSKEFNIIYLDCHFSTPDNLAVIPNPSNGNVTLSFESQISGEGVILVHNAQGNLVLTEQTFIGSGLNSIPMRITQNPGIYHVSVQIQGRYYRGIMVVQQ
ncbi:MAG: GEVED domain-containing protein, partial [Bacteroidota bacterium]